MIDKKTVRKGLLPYLFLALIILAVFYVVNVMNNDVNVLTYNEFMTELKKETLKKYKLLLEVAPILMKLEVV